MIIQSESDMYNYGKQYAEQLLSSPDFGHTPIVIELIGDVGAGKTTFTRGFAAGLGISEPVTSPSFTISKAYSFEYSNTPYTLTHYDFYRLPDPGIMAEDLSESINTPHNITIIEWADTVSNILPDTHTTITIKYTDDGSREITL